MDAGVWGLFGLVSLVCVIIILVHAFQNSIWKGLAALLCGLYLIYYAIFEFEHEHKWLIVLIALLGGGMAGLGRVLR